MKLLLIGDLHFKYKDEANIQDLEMLSQFLVKTASNIKDLTKIIILGDTLDAHERIDLLQLTRSVKLLEKLVDIAPIVVIIGNHDRLNAEEYLTDVSPFYALKRWKNTVIADTTILETVGDKKFVYVPFVPKGRFAEAIGAGWKSADLIFAHQDFSGAVDNNNYEVQDADPWSLEYPPVYSGHIHKYQKLPSGVTYVGTPYQTRFGECLHKHVLLLEHTDNSWKETYIETDIRKKIDKHLSFAELKTFKLTEAEKRHLIKIHVKCTSAEAKKVKKTKSIFGLKNVSIKTEYIEEEEIDTVSETKDQNNFFQELEKILDDKQLFWFKKLM